MFRPASDGATLIIGSSGYLGCLVAASLLAREERRLLLPMRSVSDPEDCRARIRLALLDCGVPEQDAGELMRRATFVELPSFGHFSDLDGSVSALGIDEIVHCAGSVDYYDKRSLQIANVELTDQLVMAARRWNLQRFLYLSTSYCSGYRSGIIPERLHPDPAPADEPTEYTRSKRRAEWRIADSGIPFVIIRPSIVTGDSRTGKYTGKNYGLYQMWRAIEGLLCREYYPIWYTVAPRAPVNLIHQDAFQEGFLGIYRNVLPNPIVHLVGDHAQSLTMHDLCWLWADVYCPVEIHSYAQVDDVPLHAIPKRQRRFLEIAAKNLEISAQSWKFETAGLDHLRAAGLQFADATLQTVARCQRQYIEGSERIQEHMRRYAGRSGQRTRLIEIASHPKSHNGFPG